MAASARPQRSHHSLVLRGKREKDLCAGSKKVRGAAATEPPAPHTQADCSRAQQPAALSPLLSSPVDDSSPRKRAPCSQP